MDEVSKLLFKDDQVFGLWRCSECDFSKDRKLAVVSHIQANHIQFVGYFCELCNNKSKTILAYQRHMQRFHGGLKVSAEFVQF